MPPVFHDLSFTKDQQQVHFSITQHDNLDFIIFTALERIGQVVQVIFPEQAGTEALSNQSRVEYDTKLLLGSDECPETDLFIRRLVITLAAAKRRRKLIVSLGFDGLSIELISTAITQLETYLARQIASEKEAKKEKTIFLPKTDFINHIKSTERAQLDQQLAIAGGLNDLYEWQRKRPGEIFELLDGPPFANGSPHTGHAINKILKDFIVKSRIALGYKVRFRPGWDCHGLPIELKITKNVQDKTPVEIRQMAREVALEAIAKQMNSFKRWGVSADWPNPYLTMDKFYVAEQLRMFGKLISKGLVYRSFKPVYWSPSSRSALAESELEYNEKHKSTSAYFRFKAIDISPNELNMQPDPKQRAIVPYFLIWTSTPWTIPLNNAIAVSDSAEYLAVQFHDERKDPYVNVYIIAKELKDAFAAETNRPVNVLGTINGKQLIGKHYQSCWYNELALPIITGEHVTMNMGTGLVHTSYAHGHQDYNLALKHGEKVRSFVDEKGCYTRHMGHDLEGKDVLGQGQKEVLKLLKKDILHVGKYIHSYPYDWRTKMPVIIRSSAQWFIDIKKLGQSAAAIIKDIPIGGGQADLSSNLEKFIITRQSWCISRQRVWGVPIPVVFDSNGSAHFSELLANKAADLVAEHGPDYWWSSDIDQLLTPEVKTSLGINDTTGFRKGTDIMDVWIDSGMAWHCARKNYDGATSNKPADVVLEGVDQFRGWFQSLLLTSYSINEKLAYKRVLVHGFCVDDDNKKMSKSIGNVVDPELVTDGSLRQKALGADGLRLWVALAGSENPGESRIGEKVLADIDKKIVILRNSFRFLLGGCHGYQGEIPSNLRILDQYILRESYSLLQRTVQNYNNYKFRSVMNDVLQFTQRNLSSNYVNYVRDRLYCAAPGSDEHIAAQFTLHKTGTILAAVTSPVLPHLASEFFQHLPHSEVYQKILRYPELMHADESELSWKLHNQLDEIMQLVGKLREILAIKAGSKRDISKLDIVINVSEEDRHLLLPIMATSSSFTSELCELLGVSHIEMTSSTYEADIIIKEENIGKHCERCRKMNRISGSHCERCTEALSNLC